MPPTSLLDSLTVIRRKVQRLTLATSTGWMVAMLIGLLLAVVLIDWAMVLPVGARVLLLLIALSALGTALYYWIYVPATHTVGLSDLAGRIEHTFPQFDDRLRSTVDFLRQDIPGSASMKQKVVAQTSEMAQSVNLSNVIQLRPLWHSVLMALGAIILALGIIALTSRQNLGIALNRLALGSQQWPKSVLIAMDGDIPARVPVGERIPIKLHLARGDRESRQAVIYYRYDNGPWQQELMTRSGGEYTAALDARIDQNKTNGVLHVRMEAGDDSHELSPITVVPRLDVARVDAQIVPPAYVKPRVQSSVNLSERPAVAALGSDIAVELHFNKPLAKDKPVELLPATGAHSDGAAKAVLPAIQWTRPSESVAVARFQANQSFRFSVHAVDIDNFANTSGEEYELIAREDQPPTVQIDEPRRAEDRTPDAEFDVRALAEDDYGVDAAQLVVQRIGDKATTQPAASQARNNWVIDLVQNGASSALGTEWVATDSTAERKRYRLGYHWDLSKLDTTPLKPGDVLEFYVRVKDNFDLNGKQHDWVSSGKLRLTIISHEEWNKRVNEILEQTYSALKQVDQGQQRNKTETGALQQGVDQKKKFDQADKTQADRLANQQSGTESQTSQIAQKLQGLLGKMSENKSPEDGAKKTVAEVEKQLEQTAEGAMREASHDLSDASAHPPDAKASPEQQAKDAEARSDALQKSQKSQQTSSDQLKAAMSRLGNFGGLSEAIEKFNQIKQQQNDLKDKFNKDMKNNLGKKTEEMSKEDQDAAKKMADEQNALADKTQKAIDDLEKKAEQLSKSDPATSSAMKQAAQAGQQQQVPGKQSRAAQAMQQNQQGQAQQQQQAVELGIDMIIAKLKEAERRKLEELQRQLAEIQQQIAELLKRQAGHNIDNLLLQGGVARMDKLIPADRQDLIDLSTRDAKTLDAAPAPAPPQQSASQEQTEQNTRDIAHAAEALPDATPSAKLTVAAGQMERAIVHLRETQLAEAYDPPQVSALKALQDAQRSVTEALNKANEQLNQEKQETIKQAYIKLLGEQKKVGDDIVKIDQTPRNDAGELPREVGVKLGGMPGEQGKLSETAKQLGEKLQSLGGIVYVWANNDIIKSMNEVRDDLAKPVTGQPTQAEEKRIEEQLQAMIDSLAQHKKNEEFAKRDGGGKGGGGKKPPPRMPTEAELQLLKALQLAVNKNTTKLHDEKVKEPQRLMDLGGRQGELRNLLDKLIQQTTQGKVKLGDEPDDKDQLPEEASKEDVEDQEFDKALRQDDVGGDTVDKSIKLTGDRMARSRQRVVKSDTGDVTQEIQKRIVKDFDQLIALAQQQQSQSPSPSKGQGQPGDKPGEPKPGEGKGQQEANAKGKGQPQQKPQGNSPAGDTSTASQGAPPQTDTSKELKESRETWGSITRRDREAVEEGASEKPLDKYRKFTEDYYKSVSEQAAKR